MTLKLCVFSMCTLLGSLCFSQTHTDLAVHLKPNALFFIESTDINGFCNSCEEILGKNGDDSGLWLLGEEVDALVDFSERSEDEIASKEDSCVTKTIQSVKELLGNGGFSIVGYEGKDGSIEIALVSKPNLDDLGGLIEEFKALHQQLARISVALGLLTRRESEATTESPTNDSKFAVGDFEINEIRFSALAKSEFSVYVFFRDAELVVSTSKSLATSIAEGFIDPPSRSLGSERSFRSIRSRLPCRAQLDELWFYVSPRLLNQVVSIDEIITFDDLLPYFYEKLVGLGATNELAGAGGKISLRSENEKEAQSEPRALIDLFVNTTLPRKGALAVLDKASPIVVPSLRFEGMTIDQLEAWNLDFHAVFQQLSNEYERIHGHNTWSEKSQRLQEKYKNVFPFREVYERTDNAKFGIRFRLDSSPNTSNTISLLRFKSEEDARWFSERFSQSGFLNQSFPLDATVVNGHSAFVRTKKAARKLETALGQRTSPEVFVAYDRWFLSGNPEIVPLLLNEKDNETNDLPKQISTKLDKVRRLTRSTANEPFYLSVKSPRAWRSKFANLRLMLQFEERYRDRPGFTHSKAPRNFRERLLMTIKYRVAQSLVDSLGHTVAIASVDGQAVRFTMGCFEPSELERDLSIPGLVDYVGEKESRD